MTAHKRPVGTNRTLGNHEQGRGHLPSTEHVQTPHGGRRRDHRYRADVSAPWW